MDKPSLKPESSFATCEIANKALRKTEISKFFIFASFRIVRLPKFGNFSEKPGFSKLAKILRKKFGNKYWSITSVFGSKTGVMGSETGVSKHFEFTEYSEFVLFQIFQNLKK
jgi:hypothetical protein